MATELPANCIRARQRWASCRTANEAELARSASLDAIVRHYIRHHRERAKAEMDYFAGLPSITEAKRRAGRAERPDGKRHGHQTRLTRAALRQASDVLARLNVRRCKSFAALHELLEETIGEIPGIGELMVYDTALRLGAKLGLSPRRVYLHAGTRDGAVALGFGRDAHSAGMDELPAAFRRLHPREVEDCLCIYKDRLRALNRRRGRRL